MSFSADNYDIAVALGELSTHKRDHSDMTCAFDGLSSGFRTSHPWLIKFLTLFIWDERRFPSPVSANGVVYEESPRVGPSPCVSLPLRSPRLSRLMHAAVGGRPPIESDANVTVGLIAREKVRIWTCLVSLLTMALCVGQSLLNTWGLFNGDSHRTAALPSDAHRSKNKNDRIGGKQILSVQQCKKTQVVVCLLNCN